MGRLFSNYRVLIFDMLSCLVIINFSYYATFKYFYVIILSQKIGGECGMAKKIGIKIDYSDETNDYYVYIFDEDRDIQCYFNSEEEPIIRFTRNSSSLKRVVKASVMCS